MDPSPRLEPRRPATSLSAAADSSASKLRHAAIVVAVLLVAGALFGILPRLHHSAVLRAETRELGMQTVTVVSPERREASSVLILPAEVKPFLEAPIYARASGYLKRWLVDIGAVVKEGELLAEIDAPELRQELARAKAERSQAEAALALAKTTAARWAELLKTASVSEQEAAEKQADLELKSANLEAARANVRRLEELDSFCSVYAPFAGTITARSIDVGQLITAGSTRELFRLAQTRTLRVYARVPQTASASISVGQTAELVIPELTGRTFPAKVVRTSGAVSADSRTLLTELEVDNSQNEILAGTFAQVRFTDAKLAPQLVVPANTLLFRAEGPQLGVVGPEGKVDLRDVTLGRDFGPTLEILQGISARDRVILNPPDSLVAGMTVRVAAGEPERQTAKVEPAKKAQ